jgi:hypothetical protein
VHLDELPTYATEVRYYREVLAISWEFGSHLRSLGVLVPDAQLDDGRVLFQLTPEKLDAARNAVFLAKARQLIQPTQPEPHAEISAL